MTIEKVHRSLSAPSLFLSIRSYTDLNGHHKFNNIFADIMLHEEIYGFLEGQGLECETVVLKGHTLLTCHTRSGRIACIFPLNIEAESLSEAEAAAESAQNTIRNMQEHSGEYPLIITEDRWRSRPDLMKARLLAHLEVFTQVYARNCEVRRIDRKTAAEFLAANHSYGDASCRYRYGLFLKRHTGHNAGNKRHIGELVAVATFSNARKWVKGDKTIRSYEWTRYASLPGIRVSGGMGRLLRAFTEDVKPDDIMTYADLEWSEGKVYERLGFVLEGLKSPVSFAVYPDDWNRYAIKSDAPMTGDDMPPPARGCPVGVGVNGSHGPSDCKFYTNSGSNKYRLKLTDYQ